MRLAIIPARGGSKRIPRKNIKDLFGQPVIGITITTLLESDLFSKVVVSTDDHDIASVARSFGAEVPNLRPEALSGDLASTDEVIHHSVIECIKYFGNFEQGCCVYPVNPFLNSEILIAGLQMMLNRKADTCFSVVKYDFPIEQALELIDGKPNFCWPEKMVEGSQKLKNYFHDAAMFYWFETESFIRNGVLFGANSVCLEIDPMQCQDINTPEDWELAKLKLARINEKG